MSNFAKVSIGSILIPSHLALKWFLSGVTTVVYPHLSRSSETFVTVAALVRQFPRVYGLVNAQGSKSSKHF